MNPLKDLIQLCHQRHKNPLRQRKTVVAPALYNKGYPYHFTVYCAHRYPMLLTDLETANISFMPIGQAPDNDHGPRTLGGESFLRRQGTQDWGMRRWHASWGIQVYTGIPSERDGARWHDFDFTYKSICAAPDAILTCIEALVDAVPNPLLTMSKSGGLRFSCRVPNYLHPNTEKTKLYIYKHTPTSDKPDQRDLYLEIFGEEGYNRWDARYEILLGNLFDPPIVDKEVVFAPIDALRATLHEPAPEKITEKQIATEVPFSLGSHNLDLAKETLIKRGFSYVRQDNGYHLWIPSNSKVDDRYISLWENEETVWLRASTTDIGLPTQSTPITDIWDDTGIMPLTPLTGIPVPDKIRIVREGKLSPLAIKRPSPVLYKSKQTEKVYKTLKNNGVQIQEIFDRTDRILGLIAETGTKKHYDAVSHASNDGSACLNLPTYELAEELETRYQSRDFSLFKR